MKMRTSVLATTTCFLVGAGMAAATASAQTTGDRVTAPVQVEGGANGSAGQQVGVNGINGSRDATATQGTGSLTSEALTVASKAPRAIKDVPQTVSVLTAERIAQQNITDYRGALDQLPGVTLVQSQTSLDVQFYARGFELNTFQIDGGAPLLSTNVDYGAAGQFPLIDMAVYDHVEVLRGAAGTFNGYGSAAGVVNLVRKKPLNHREISTELLAGSWDTYRAVGDVSLPIAFAGKLRARVIGTAQDNHFFYDTAKDRRGILYGIAELDATPTTLLTIGASESHQQSRPWGNGLPRYQNGADLELPRDTSFALPWNRRNLRTTELFAGVEQKIASDWIGKLNFTRSHQRGFQKYGANTGAVNPLSGRGPTLTGYAFEFGTKQTSIEGTVNGSFELFGLRQELTFGANHVNVDSGGQRSYGSFIRGTAAAPYIPYPGGPAYYPGSPNGSVPPIDVFGFDPNDPRYSEPGRITPALDFGDFGNERTVAYASARLTPISRVHLDLGVRWSRFRSKYQAFNRCATIPTTGTPGPRNCVGRQTGDLYVSSNTYWSADDFSWPPTGALSFDMTKSLTAYVGYADIYESQGNYVTSSLTPVDPITGSTIEFGLKWAPYDGRLNVTASAYRTRRRNFAVQEGVTDTRVTPADRATGIFYYVVAPDGSRYANGLVDGSRTCCYTTGPDQTQRSQGIDLEVTGQVVAGLQVSASYNYNENKYDGVSYGANEGLPFITIQPKHIYRVWATYDFGAAGTAGFLSNAAISGGVNGRSSAYRSGTACTDILPPNALGVSSCRAGATAPFEFTVPSYAVMAARVDYRVTPDWSLALNLDNLLDKTYYQTVGSVTSGNWYGAPRSFTVSLRGRW